MSDVIATLNLKAWHKFKADLDEAAIHDWLSIVAQESTKAFMDGTAKAFPPASSAGDWPATRSGGLRGSFRADVHGMEVVVSTNTYYSGYLRYGTSKMGRRKMSDNALEEGTKAAEGRMKHWVGWER